MSFTKLMAKLVCSVTFMEYTILNPCLHILYCSLVMCSRMMVLRMGSKFPSVDSVGSAISLEHFDGDNSHIDQLDEPPIAQRMGVMAAFSSFDEFAE